MPATLKKGQAIKRSRGGSRTGSWQAILGLQVGLAEQGEGGSTTRAGQVLVVKVVQK